VPAIERPKGPSVRANERLARQLRGASYDRSNRLTPGAVSVNADDAPFAHVVGMVPASAR
jgi:hypothetical protein